MLDEFNQVGLGLGLGIEVDFSLLALWVLCSLNQIIEWRGAPEVILFDTGPEGLSGLSETWAETRSIWIDYIQPGEPQQNAYIERYNRRVSHECLDQNILKRSRRDKTKQLNGSGLTKTDPV